MNILIVDDETNILNTTSVALETIGHKPYTAFNTRQAMRNLQDEPIDLIFLDIKLGNEDGLQFLRQLREDDWDLPIIIFTAYSSIESAVNAMKAGATDYIQKPFIPEEIREMLKKVERNVQLQAKVNELESYVSDQNPAIIMNSEDPDIQATYDMAFKAAKSHANILILGPSGTGKTILARQLHYNSLRADHPFVTVNCPSLSKELLESELFGHVKGAFTGAIKETWGKVAAAEGGTLFLDEIGELPLEIQPKLLRLLQEGEYERIGETRTRKCDIRVIAATNRNLGEEVENHEFREDLYYRLKVIEIPMHALVERPADIVPMAENYLNFFAKREGKRSMNFSDSARAALLDYDWPGNMRELRNVIERAIILSNSDLIDEEALPPNMSNKENSAIRPGHFVSLAELTEEHVKQIISKTNSLEQAAEILDIDTATLYRKRKRMGLVKAGAREASEVK